MPSAARSRARLHSTEGTLSSMNLLLSQSTVLNGTSGTSRTSAPAKLRPHRYGCQDPRSYQFPVTSSQQGKGRSGNWKLETLSKSLLQLFQLCAAGTELAVGNLH